MRDRFTHRARLGRGSISKYVRDKVLRRDSFTCQYCQGKFPPKELTIDHIVPLAKGGLDEVTNYITACRECNQRKAAQTPAAFTDSIDRDVTEVKVHGDMVIDNADLPIQMRLIRKRLFDQHRQGQLNLTGKSAQKKLEKAFRREFWQTPDGRRLEEEFPSLPGHTRVMIPEIRMIAKNEREFYLLVELAKSASTRNLVGTLLTPDVDDVEGRFRSSTMKSRNPAMKRRMENALRRFEKKLLQAGIR